MPSVCFYFQVHQPWRIKNFSVFDIGQDKNYFNSQEQNNLNNKLVLDKVCKKCYLPANKLLLKLLKKHPEFKISFSLSGVLLEQLEKFSPETLKSFQDLVKTGKTELLSETYYHSLCFLKSKQEFKNQINLHKKKIKKLFNFEPEVFRNTELIYNNNLAEIIESLGFKAMLTEGADHVLKSQSPNFIYKPVNSKKLKLLLKNYQLSDDIAFRFSSQDWEDFPLTSEKFANWISNFNGNGEIINLFMDYETFGEHQWEETGIFNFLENLPREILKNPDNNFITPIEAIKKYPVRGEFDSQDYISWADVERDLSAWMSNSMQSKALDLLYDLENDIIKTDNKKLINNWRKLQTSDHFYYMCTKWFSDGDVHKYFNPYDSPYEAFICFMNALNDLKLRIKT